MEIISTDGIDLNITYLAKNLSFAREACGKTVKECSLMLGIPTSRLKNYEKGKYVPSLPELETLSFLFRIPILAFFKEHGVNDYILTPKSDQTQRLIEIRQQIIGAQIHLAREKLKLSLQKLSKTTSIPSTRIKRYEEGTAPIAVDDLQKIVNGLNLDLNEFFDQKSPLGIWQNNQSKNKAFEHLPEEIKEFIANSNYLHYLKIAHQLSMVDIETVKNLSDTLAKLTDSLKNS